MSTPPMSADAWVEQHLATAPPITQRQLDVLSALTGQRCVRKLPPAAGAGAPVPSAPQEATA